MLLERLFVEIAADVSKLERGLRTADRDLTRFARRIEGAGRALTVGLTVPLGIVAGASVHAAAQMDSLRLALDAVTGSGQATAARLKELEEIARRPGIGFREAIQADVRLQAVGVSAERSARLLREFANAIAMTGGGAAELARVTVQLGQLSAKGKILSQDLRPIIEAAPAVGRALLEAFGTVDPSDIEALGLTTDEFLDKLMDQLSTLPRVAGGARNSFENFTDALFKARVAIGEQLLPIVTPLIEAITKMAEGLRDVNPTVVRWGIAFGGALAAMGPVLIMIGQLIPLIAKLRLAGMGLAAIFGVGSLLVVGLTAVVALLLGIAANSAEAARQTRNLAEATERLAEAHKSANAQATLGLISNYRAELQELGRQLGAMGDVGMDPRALREQANLIQQIDVVRTKIAALEQQYIDLTTAADGLRKAGFDEDMANATGLSAAEKAAKRLALALWDSVAAKRELDRGDFFGVPGKTDEKGQPLDDLAKRLEDLAPATKGLKDMEEMGQGAVRWATMFADHLANVVMQIESVSDALKAMLQALIRIAIQTAVLAGLGFIFGGPAGALAGARAGLGLPAASMSAGPQPSSVGGAPSGTVRFDLSSMRGDEVVIARSASMQQVFAEGLLQLEASGFRVEIIR